MRVDLSEFQHGAWADVLDTVPYKVLKAATSVAMKKDPSEDDTERANSVLLNTMVRSWNVKDATGADCPIPASAKQDQLEMVDGFIITKLFETVIEMVKAKGKKADPNSETASSTS